MSTPMAWAWRVSSTHCLAVSVLDITCTSAPGLTLRASAVATATTDLSSSVVSDQNSPIPPVSQMPSWSRSTRQCRTSARSASQSMSSPSVPENGVYSELQLPHKCCEAQSLASLPVTGVATSHAPFPAVAGTSSRAKDDDYRMRAMVERHMRGAQTWCAHKQQPGLSLGAVLARLWNRGPDVLQLGAQGCGRLRCVDGRRQSHGSTFCAGRRDGGIAGPSQAVARRG